MGDYYIGNVRVSSNDLYHYGVKGMTWGKHKKRKTNWVDTMPSYTPDETLRQLSQVYSRKTDPHAREAYDYALKEQHARSTSGSKKITDRYNINSRGDKASITGSMRSSTKESDIAKSRYNQLAKQSNASTRYNLEKNKRKDQNVQAQRQANAKMVSKNMSKINSDTVSKNSPKKKMKVSNLLNKNKNEAKSSSQKTNKSAPRTLLAGSIASKKADKTIKKNNNTSVSKVKEKKGIISKGVSLINKICSKKNKAG